MQHGNKFFLTIMTIKLLRMASYFFLLMSALFQQQ
jgi:hypothetical protein